MKTLMRMAIGVALGGYVLNHFLRKRRIRSGASGSDAAARSSIDDIPVVQPVEDAEPRMREPLEPQDLRVAQNTPL